MNSVYFETIIVGAGAAGLYCACNLKGEAAASVLILEKNKKAGRKLLMTGNGQCNVTHGGSIKDFVTHYGDKGRSIRGLLQKYSNIQLRQFLEGLGLPLTEREDGKMFPASMAAGDVLKTLLDEISRKDISIRYESEVTGIEYAESHFTIHTKNSHYRCKNLIIATGGCSYAGTGSDGKMLDILAGALNIEVVKPRPVLAPVYVEDYCFAELSGISFKDIYGRIETKDGRKLHDFTGDLLFTSKNLSGPAILNNSRRMAAGLVLTVNFAAPAAGPEIIARCKRDFPGNGKSPQVYMSETLKLPKRFAAIIADKLALSHKKVSQLTGQEISALSSELTAHKFTIQRVGGFNEAMATGGGVSLNCVNPKTMSHSLYEGLYIIGEAVDVDGDTGGYNLQFAYSSAKAAADSISSRKAELST